MTNHVCAIIISYDDLVALKKTTEAIYDQVNHIYVINNFSNQALSDQLMSLYEDDIRITLLLLDENHGIAYALNRGVELASQDKNEWILTMDQDSIASPNMIQCMLDCMNSFSIDNNKSLNCFFSSFRNKDVSASPCKEIYMGITSGNLIHSSIFKKFGYYNESYFIDSVDFEFFLRIKNEGVKFYQVTNAKMAHSLGTQKNNQYNNTYLSNTYTHSPLRRYYIVRNHFYLCKMYFVKNPIYLTWKTLNIFKLFISIIVFEKGSRIENLKMITIGINDFYRKKTGKFQQTG